MSGPLALFFVLAVGIAEVLPVSGRAHAVALGLAFDQPIEAPLRAAAHTAAAIALLVVSGRRLRALLSSGERRDGTRAPSERLGLGLGLLVGLTGAFAFRLLARSVDATPIAVGFGLLATGVMLASTSAAQRASSDALTLRRGLLAGMAQALAALPGGSALGAAIAALVWTGMRPRRAVETACALTAGHEIFLAVSALGETGVEKRLLERPGLWLVALAAATIAGALAAGRLPKAAEKRLVTFGAYAAVLGLSLIAYGWALH